MWHIALCDTFDKLLFYASKFENYACTLATTIMLKIIPVPPYLLIACVPVVIVEPFLQLPVCDTESWGWLIWLARLDHEDNGDYHTTCLMQEGPVYSVKPHLLGHKRLGLSHWLIFGTRLATSRGLGLSHRHILFCAGQVQLELSSISRSKSCQILQGGWRSAQCDFAGNGHYSFGLLY